MTIVIREGELGSVKFPEELIVFLQGAPFSTVKNLNISVTFLMSMQRSSPRGTQELEVQEPVMASALALALVLLLERSPNL